MFLISRCAGVILGLTLSVSCFAGDAQKDSELSVLLDARVTAILQLQSDKTYGEYLAAQCMTCHANSDVNEEIPTLHGQDKVQLIQALIEYKAKLRTNTTMQSVVNGLNDEDMGALAQYFSTQ